MVVGESDELVAVVCVVVDVEVVDVVVVVLT